MKKDKDPVLRLLKGAEELLIPSMDGQFVFQNIEGSFTAVDPIEKYKMNIGSQPTIDTKVSVYELVGGDSTFYEILLTLSPKLDSLCLTQGQINEFIERYPKCLCSKKYGTFFLFKSGSENLFIMYVYFNDFQKIEKRIFHLRFDIKWYAVRHPRFVVPLLTSS